MSEFPALTVGSKVRVEKGCVARNLRKGMFMQVAEIIEGERGSVRVIFVPAAFPQTGTRMSWYAQHKNRLADHLPAFNDGNPLHRITVRRA